MESASRTLSRRDFLRAALGVGVGAAAGVATVEVAIPMQQEVAKLTDKNVGNVSQQELLATACGNQPTKECGKQFMESQALSSILSAPPFEEMIFRGMFSVMCDEMQSRKISPDLYQPDADRSVYKTTLCGHPGGLNSMEIAFGLVSTTAFAYAHNAKMGGGFEFNSLPVAQFAFGGVAWALQRKFGIASNTVAHAAANASLLLY